MNIGHDHHNERDDLDAKLRQVHALAVDHVSPRTSARLRPQRAVTPAAPAKPRLRAWPVAATCAIALIVGGFLLRQSRDAPTESLPAIAIADNNDPADVYAVLDESPELYLWLASNDTQLALE